MAIETGFVVSVGSGEEGLSSGDPVDVDGRIEDLLVQERVTENEVSGGGFLYGQDTRFGRIGAAPNEVHGACVDYEIVFAPGFTEDGGSEREQGGEFIRRARAAESPPSAHRPKSDDFRRRVVFKVLVDDCE